jgi:tRNA threonylcarbamoyladenosine biosynthesis protein TsaB
VDEGRNGWVCPLLDARKKEVYGALFRREAGITNRAMDDVVATPSDVLQRILSITQGEPCLFIGTGSRLYADAIRGAFGNKAQIGSDASRPSIAFAVARIGEEKIRNGEGGPAGLLILQYLRPSEAELGQSAGK